VPLDYPRHVPGSDLRVPDVVGIDEDDRALVVATGAGVAQHGGRREPAPLELRPERLEELSATFATTALFSRGGAHEDLA